jgi:hypothetical protein
MFIRSILRGKQKIGVASICLCVSYVGYKKAAKVCESVCVVLGEEPRSGLTARKDLCQRE